MTIITHTREAGTLIEGTAKGDGSNAVLKAAGWRWSRNLGTWYVPHTRDRAARRHLIMSTSEQLREAGIAVEVEINDTARPTAACFRRTGRSRARKVGTRRSSRPLLRATAAARLARAALIDGWRCEANW